MISRTRTSPSSSAPEHGVLFAGIEQAVFAGLANLDFQLFGGVRDGVAGGGRLHSQALTTARLMPSSRRMAG
jgi:hypothetical protein